MNSIACPHQQSGEPNAKPQSLAKQSGYRAHHTSNAALRGGRLSKFASMAVAGMLFSGAITAQAAPGNPGVPSAPIELFKEDFENVSSPTQFVMLTDYTGTEGTTYSADSAWLQKCNGMLVAYSQSSTDSQGTSACGKPNAWNGVRVLALGIAEFEGFSGTTANQKRAVAAYTSGNPGGNKIEFRTASNVNIPAPPAGSQRFVSFQVVVGAASCQATAKPLLQFYLVDSTGNEIPAGERINGCGSKTTGFNYNAYASGGLLFSGSSLGIVMRNEESSGAGNDHAFDNIVVLDSTPQLDKSYPTSSVAAGQPANLVFTITNTSELGSKQGWGFEEKLPAGLKVAGSPSNTCTATVSAVSGSDKIVVTAGKIAKNSKSCTITIPVTAASGGTYTSAASDTTSRTALYQPADAEVTFFELNLDVTKSGSLVDSNSNGRPDVSEKINYTVEVSNNTGTNVTGVSVTDSLPGVTLSPSSQDIPAGQSRNFTGQYTLTATDIDRGFVDNSVSASGTASGGSSVTGDGETKTTLTRTADFAVDKAAASIPSPFSYGDQIDYTITITNTGNVTLTGVTPSDPYLDDGLELVSPPGFSGTLNAGDAVTYSGAYTPSQSDIDTGSYLNEVTVTATPPSGTGGTITRKDDETTTITAQPSMAVSKTSAIVDSNGNGYLDPGESINYTIEVENTGNVTLTNVVPTDTLQTVPTQTLALTPSGPVSIQPGDTSEFTTSYTPTQDDIDSGELDNSVSVSANGPSGALTPVSNVEKTTITPSGTFTVEKSATLVSAGSLFAAGDTINYQIVVTNTGNTTLTIPTNAVADTLSNGQTLSVTPPGSSSIAPGSSATFTASYTAQQTDIDNLKLSNTANVTLELPDSSSVSENDVIETTFPITAILDFEKLSTYSDSSTPAGPSVGDEINYTLKAFNRGNVTISNVLPTDPLLTAAGISLSPSTPQDLAPNTSVDFTATYTLVQADVDRGYVLNKASVTGDSPNGATVSADDENSTDSAGAVSIAVEKRGQINDINTNGITDVGDAIDYTVTVLNDGVGTVSNVSVSDITYPSLTFSPASVATLAPTATATFTASLALTQAMIDSGKVSNQARSSATTTNAGAPTITADNSTSNTIQAAPQFTITKTSDYVAGVTPAYTAGDVITYTFAFENTGNVTLENVSITDARLDPGSLTPASVASVAPGATTSFSGTHTITQSELDSGSLSNIATATATPIGGGPSISKKTNTVNVPFDEANQLDVSKTVSFVGSATSSNFNLGDQLKYTVTVTNNGNISLTDINVVDSIAGVTLEPDPSNTATLQPGQTNTYVAVYTPTLDDINSGSLVNEATVSAKTAAKGTSITNTAQQTTTFTPNPGLSVVKTASFNSGRLNPGDEIEYRVTVTNSGNVTLSNVQVTDPLPGLTLTPLNAPFSGILAPGDSVTYVGSYTLLTTDIDAGEVSNTASATGDLPVGGGTIPAQSSNPAIVPLTSYPEMKVEKTSTLNDTNSNGLYDLSETIDYTIRVTNTGNVTLDGVLPTDTLQRNDGSSEALTLAPSSAQSIAPGAYIDFTTTYQITQADVDIGGIWNEATATGTPPPASGASPLTLADKTLPSIANNKPDLSLVMTGVLDDADKNDVGDVDETVKFTLVVTNTGNSTLTNVRIESRLPNAEMTTSDPTTLAPGESITFYGEYSLTEDDYQNTSLQNIAQALGDTGYGESYTSDDAQAVVSWVAPSLLLAEKTATLIDIDNSGTATAGDQIRYVIAVTNDGGQSLTDVKPVDDGVVLPDGSAGTGKLSAFTPASASLGSDESIEFTALYTISEKDFDIAVGDEVGITNTASAVAMAGLQTLTAAGSSASIKIDAIQPGDISITKTAATPQIHRGEKAQFTITVINNTDHKVANINIRDRIPSGFRYVEGSGSINGAVAAPQVTSRDVIFEDVSVEADGKTYIRLAMTALSTLEPGTYQNTAFATDRFGVTLAPKAVAEITILVDPVFDCGDLIGRVFDDKNRNGYHDDAEPGLPGVRVATVNGLLVTTDEFGRFHVACAALPDNRIGSNFIMKLDERTLPSGYSVTTENPRVVRLTAGKMTKLNFGASIGRVVSLDLTDSSFITNEIMLKPGWLNGLDQVVQILAAEPSLLKINYYGAQLDTLARQRLQEVSKEVRTRWQAGKPPYQLEISTQLEAGQ